MVRFEQAHNQVHANQTVAAGHGAVAVVNVPALALRSMPGKSKRHRGSMPAGLDCAGTTDCRTTLLRDLPSRLESERSQIAISDPIGIWHEPPAPAWASLILSYALSY